MKKIIILFCVLLPFTAFSNEIIRLSGSFNFEKTTLVQTRDVEIVDQYSRWKLPELSAQGYQCNNAGASFICHKFLDQTDIPLSILNSVNNEWSAKSITFTLNNIEPSQTNDADVLKEWDIFDSVTIGNEIANQYHYYLLDGVIHKLCIQTKENAYWSVINNEKSFYLPIERSITYSRTHYRQFFLAVNFK